MRRTVKAAMSLEKRSPELAARSAYSVEFEEDEKACEGLIAVVSGGILEMDSSNISTRSIKWGSMLHHLISRIKNSQPTSEEEESRKPVCWRKHFRYGPWFLS